MARFAPFEPKPHVAVAVSGGADSMALALLSAQWARARAGRATALTVDHGLRRESRAEAARVARWLRRRRMTHRVLRWAGSKPAANIQAAARAARYALLENWCRDHGVLHLLLAHQREDQAETLLLRLVRGSGAFGLAGMPAAHERAAVRHLRPLLGVGRHALEATLRAQNQRWIDDPSNRNEAFARVRLRRGATLLEREGASPKRLATTAAHVARARAALERQIALCLARAVTLFPEGYAVVDRNTLTDEDHEIGLRALAAVLTTVAGAETSPRYESLEALHRDIFGPDPFKGRTLGGCRLAVNPTGPGLLIVRELSAVATRQRAALLRPVRWDGRFILEGTQVRGQVVPLGEQGVAELARRTGAAHAAIPRLACLPLPSFRSRRGLDAAPALGYFRSARRPPSASGFAIFQVQKPLAGAYFAAVPELAAP